MDYNNNSPKNGHNSLGFSQLTVTVSRGILNTVSFVRYFNNTTHMSFGNVSPKLTVHSPLTASSLPTTRKCIGKTVPNTATEYFVQSGEMSWPQRRSYLMTMNVYGGPSNFHNRRNYRVLSIDHQEPH